MSDYVKLADNPVLVIQNPTCSACCVDLISEDGWLCPVCGSSWSYDDGDGDKGELYESWSGETLSGEPLGEDEAMCAGIAFEREQGAKALARLRGDMA